METLYFDGPQQTFFATIRQLILLTWTPTSATVCYSLLIF